MSKRKVYAVIGFFLLITGAAVMLYPYACQVIYQRSVERIISGFTERMEHNNGNKEGEENWDWLYKLMVGYNKKLYENQQKDLVDPFSYQQVDFSLMQFGFAEEMIGYLTVPKMGINLPIYLGATTENMRKGAVHLTQTSLPVGGVDTNAVIAAHRGMSTAAMFRDIEELGPGDEVTITNFREVLNYRVTDIKVINPTDIQEILIQPGRDMVTLITCHPYRHNYQRYVVYCERVLD